MTCSPFRPAIVAAFAAVACLATSLTAQTPFSSSIAGTIRDGSGAVVQGVTVTITAPSLIGGAQVSSSSADGTYRFVQLPSGVYDIAVHAAGFRPLQRPGLRVGSGASVTLDHELAVATVTDTVVIRGNAPIVDVRSAAVPVRLDEDLLENLPTSRSIAGLINLAPGISSNVAFGGSQAGNEILIDGVRMTDPVLQDPGLRANYNWVQEVNVVALGAPAEYGGFTGAAAFATLRSGSNRFSGLGEFWTTQPSWLSSNTEELSATLQRQFDSRELIDWYDSSAQLGGPLVTDRLWFFAGLQYARYNDRPAGYAGPGSRDETDRQFIVKPTASITPRLRLDGYVEHGTSRVYGDWLSSQFPIESSNDNWAPQTSWNAHAAWTLSQRTIAEARYGGYDKRWWSDPHQPATYDAPYPRYERSTQQWSQNTNWCIHDDSSVHTASAVLSHFVDGVFGVAHELKIGTEYEATSARQELRYPGGRNYHYNLGVPVEVEVWPGFAGQATTGRNLVFAQDTWALTNRLTLSPGIRLEWNRGSVPGKENVFRTRTIGPRFGVAWDLRGDHRTVVRAHVGRYYDAIFSSRIAQADVSDSKPSIWYRIDGPDQWVELFRSSVQPYAIDPDLDHSHVDQIVVGVEQEIAGAISLQAQYIRRRFDTFMGLIDTGSVYAPTQRRDPGQDGVLGTGDDGAMLDVFNLTNPGNNRIEYTNPDDAFNNYDAVQFVGRKRYSRDWQLQGSYTWSRNRGTVGNRWHVNAARFDLGQPGRFVNPNLGINALGSATFDPTHEAKMIGTYRVPYWGGFMMSGVYRYMTGQAWGRVAFVTGFAQGSSVSASSRRARVVLRRSTSWISGSRRPCRSRGCRRRWGCSRMCSTSGTRACRILTLATPSTRTPGRDSASHSRGSIRACCVSGSGPRSNRALLLHVERDRVGTRPTCAEHRASRTARLDESNLLESQQFPRRRFFDVARKGIQSGQPAERHAGQVLDRGQRRLCGVVRAEDEFFFAQKILLRHGVAGRAELAGFVVNKCDHLPERHWNPDPEPGRIVVAEHWAREYADAHVVLPSVLQRIVLQSEPDARVERLHLRHGIGQVHRIGIAAGPGFWGAPHRVFAACHVTTRELGRIAVWTTDRLSIPGMRGSTRHPGRFALTGSLP